MKKIVIINGHPDKERFSDALVSAYIKGAEKNSAEISLIKISELHFDPILRYGYAKRMETEPDLSTATEQILKADHLIWVFPMWWYGLPALMKGFIDRVFLPNVTFRYKKGSALPEKLLKGKTARIIITSDSPRWYDYFFMRSPAINQLKRGTLEFCGVRPVKVSYAAPMKNSSDAMRNKWLRKIEMIGEKEAR